MSGPGPERDIVKAYEYINLGRDAQAMALLTAMLTAHPDLAGEIHLAMATAHSAAHRQAEGVAAARVAVQHLPDDARTHAVLGMLLHESAKPRQALASLERSLALDPDEATTHQQCAMVLTDLFRRRRGEESARRAIALDPDDPGSWFVLGYALHGRDRRAAVDAYRRALSLDPSHVASQNNLGILLVEAGEAAAGTHHLTNSLAAAPQANITRSALDQVLARLVVRLQWITLAGLWLLGLSLNTALTRLQRVTTIGLWVLGAAVWLSFAPRELSFDSGTGPLAVLTGLHCLGIALVAYLGSAPLRAELPRAGSRHLRTWPRRDPESASQLRVILLIWLMLVVGLVVSLATGSAWGTVVATVLAALLNVGRFVVATYKEQMQSFG